MTQKTLVCAVLLTASLPAATPAATLKVPADFPSVQVALGAASSGDVIELESGSSHYGPAVVPSTVEGITIRGEDPTVTFIGGVETQTSLRIEELRMSNAFGTAITVTAPSSLDHLRVDRCRFMESTTGIEIEQNAQIGSVEIIDSEVSYRSGVIEAGGRIEEVRLAGLSPLSDDVGGSGGLYAVQLKDAGSIVIESCTMAEELYLVANTLSIRDSEFRGYGGRWSPALRANVVSSVEVSECDFQDLLVELTGESETTQVIVRDTNHMADPTSAVGNVRIYAEDVLVERANFAGRTQLVVVRGSAEVKDCKFYGTPWTALEGVHLDSLLITDTVFSRCENRGVEASNVSSLKIQRCVFFENQTYEACGGHIAAENVGDLRLACSVVVGSPQSAFSFSGISETNIWNTTIWRNGGGSADDPQGDWVGTCVPADVASQWTASRGNVHADPVFASSTPHEAQDWSLAPGSPGCGATSLREVTWSELKAAYR